MTDRIPAFVAEFWPILALAPESFRLLAESFAALDIIIGSAEGGIKCFCALHCPHPEDMFAAAKIKVAPPVNIVLEKGVLLEREAKRIRGKVGVHNGENGKRILHYLCRPARFANLSLLLKKGDYIRLTLTPTDSLLPHNGYTKEVNAVFQVTPCYAFTLVASSSKIAAALIADLRTAGGDFCICEGTAKTETQKRVGSHVLTCLEADFLLGGIGTLCSELFPKTLHGCMSPAQVVNLPIPDVVIGKNSGIPVGLRFSDLLINLAVLGLPGSGKSTLLLRIAAALHNKKIPLIILAPLKFDFSQALLPYCDLYRAGDDEYPLRFNPLDVPPTHEAVSIAAAALAQVIPASADWLNMFYENTLTGLVASANGKPVGLSELACACKADFDLGGYTSNKESLSMKEAMLNRPRHVYFKSEFNTSVSNIDFDRMMEPGRITLIELHHMESSSRRVFGSIFLQRLMYAYRNRLDSCRSKMKSFGGLSFALMIDELHEMLAANSADGDAFRDALNSSLSTARGMGGVAHILADQRFDLLGEIVTHGCSNHIFLNQPASAQIASLLSLKPESDFIEMMPYFGIGEGLLHLARSKTIPFDAKLVKEEKLLPSKLTEAPVKAFLPYPSVCAQVCTGCQFKIHKAAFEGVAGQLSGASGSYGEYVRAVRSAKTLDDLETRSNAIYMAKSKLLKACIDVAMKKAEAAGLNTKGNTKIIQHCVKHELQRQLSFRI